MIQITPHMRILVAVAPADFRRGIDGLARICRQELREEPFSGCLFLFRNRKGTAIKGLVYDGSGFWLCHKRLSKGRFRFWPADGTGGTKMLEPHQVHLLINGGNPEAGKTAPPPWKRIRTTG